MTETFASKIYEKLNAIKRLSELKLSYDDNPYDFIREVRVNKDLFNTLKIDIEVILQCFVWNGMNSSVQTYLVQIGNNNRPSFSEINANIFRVQVQRTT